MQQFFVLGNPRSGTSLLRLILNNHSQIVVPPECGFFLWWSKKYEHWTEKNNNDKKEVEQFISDLRLSKKIETWDLDFNILRRNIEKEKPKNYLTLCQQVYLTFAQQKNKTPVIIGDKNNYYIEHAKELHKLMPSAQFIHIIRDGRDVACSYKAIKKICTNSPYKPVLSTDIVEIAKEWKKNNENVLDLSQKLTNERIISIRYEDLVSKPEETAQKLAYFLKVPYDPNMLLYYKNNQLNKEEPPQTLDWKLKTLEKPDESNVNKYKKLLTSAEIEYFNNIGSELLRKFGYEC